MIAKVKALAYRAWLWLVVQWGNVALWVVEHRWMETRKERADRIETDAKTEAGDIVNGVDLERVGIIIEGVVSRHLGGSEADISTVVLHIASETEKAIANRIARECVKMAKSGCRADQVARHARRRVVQVARAMA